MVAVRRLCDLDADIAAIDAVPGRRPALGPSVRRPSGLRVPGAVAGLEVLVRAVVGQQISVAAARTILGRIVERCVGARTHVGERPAWTSPRRSRRSRRRRSSPTPTSSGLGLTGRRIDTLHAAADAVVGGELRPRPRRRRRTHARRLLAIPGIGPWTVEYVAMRALADPDAFPGTDLVLARVARGWTPRRWRPWRAYAAMHLWTQLRRMTDDPAASGRPRHRSGRGAWSRRAAVSWSRPGFCAASILVARLPTSRRWPP